MSFENTVPQTDNLGRAQWPRLLSALPPQDVRACAQVLIADCQVCDVALPQSGLGLLQLRDSALGENYFLGEIPVARAHVRISRSDGASTEGAAQLLDDRASLAHAIAILDAIKAAHWPGHEQIDLLLEAGATRIEAEAISRRALLARTLVDFSLLATTDEHEDEDDDNATY